MPEISKDVVALLQYLAPGFLVAWVYFGMTSHTKPSQFERLVQALIYTVVIQALVHLEKVTALFLGNWRAIGPWTNQSDVFASLITALAAGMVVAAASNRDLLYIVLRRLRLTTRTAHPCEWFGIFSDYPRFVVLQLKDDTRVYGWPAVWPSDADKGHFFITQAMRTVDGIDQDLPHLEGLLVNVADVAYVEFSALPDNLNG